MKKILIIFFIAILSLAFIYHNNNSPNIIISNLLRKGHIRTGELIYRIYFLGVLPVGEASFGVEKEQDYRGERIYHLSANAYSLKLYSKLFSGRAFLDSYIDRHSYNPLVFKQRLEVSGKPTIDKEVLYDQKDGVMTLAGVKRQILPDTQDPLSAVFNIRRMDFSKVNDFELNLNTNQKNYILKGIAQPRDILINQKKYNLVLLKGEIRRKDKSPYHQSQVTMVLLKDKGNIPILIKVFASGILINAKLIEIK